MPPNPRRLSSSRYTAKGALNAVEMNARLLSLVTQPYSEKRRAPRRRTLKAASIAFNDRQSVITCTIRNLSASGALLILPHMHMTPDDFEVFFEGSYRSARVVRRAGMSLGVAWT
jgi:PilZ domain-containing protein